MTPAQALDQIIPEWTASMAEKYSPAFIVNLVSKHRASLEEMVAAVLGAERLKKGKRPKYDYDFAAYAAIVPEERALDDQPDDVVVRRVQQRMTRMVERAVARADAEARAEARAQAEADALEMALTFIRMRAEAVLLREAGWDAVPLLRRFPSLVVMARDSTAAIRDWRGTVHLRAGFGALGPITVETEKKIAAIEVTASGSRIDRYAMAFWARARALAGASMTPDEPEEMEPDLRGVSWRREANLKAMRMVLSKEASDFTAAERQILAGYSGWGGLSIEKVESQLPPELIPETFGLIHEYYTPPRISKGLAETLCPLLAELAGADGVVHALEPSAGIGRLIRGFSPRLCLALEAGGQIKRIHWTAVEYSKVSSTLLRALRPDIDLYHMPFERWIREESARVRGTISLIVSNPPYGERGAMAREDPDDFYKEKRAYAYFMRRALDLLVPGGIGVFLVPAGFLSGSLNRGLREKLLLRNHLLGAFRLPSHDRKGHENVPGASVVMDMIFWRSRGGELTEVDEADRYILDGDYFVQNKDHLLGVEEGPFSGEDEAGKTTSWRYKVTGELPTRLPPLAPRPVCTSCALNVIAPREAGTFQTVVRGDDGIPADVVGDLRHALELGARVDRYLAALGADEADRVNALWPELNAALRDFAASFGNPARSAELRELAGKRGLQAAQQILNAFDRSGALISALREPPRIEPKFAGPADDVVAQAELLFRTHRELSVKKLLEFHAKQGGTRSREDALAALIKAEWNLDGDAWDELYPRDAYLAGYELWARHDRAKARAARGDEQARVQVRRLLEAIKPAVFEDITDIDPRHGYIDLALVSGWLSSTLNANYGRIELERVGGFVQIRGYDYIDADAPPVSPDVLTFLGYYNHDPEMFRPPQEKRDRDAPPMTREEKAAAKQSLGDRRVALAKKWAESFVQYIAADPERREALTNAYNRAARGRIVPTYSAEPLYIARWGAGAPKPRAHQIAGARRVLDLLGGLIAFDVGVGKTYTALMIIARARQEGVVRRPVILVPSSLVWKWHDDILCTLPDYRVLVIGSKRKRISRGDRKGLMTSETDTPQERAQKWQLLQSGQADVVVLSYDALARTKMNEAAVVRYVEEVEAVQRSVALRRRALQEQAKNEKAKDKLSERDRALLEHGVKAWIEEILALPSDWTYDPGIAWDDIGIDMLVVDEAAGFKNLHMPQAREDGVPKFMGGGGDGSDRAWQLDFRAAAVRRRTGGAGIVLLTATPAKNSPLEFYNLIQFIDPTAFTRAGIRDPEQFIDRFLKIEIREVLDSTFEIIRRSAVTGFKNLEDLRTLIFRYGEFRTAQEVGLKLPRPVVETITIAMDEVQEAKYRHYVARIEEILSNPNPDSSPGNVILGLLARLSLIALHGSLEDGYNYRTALNGGVVDRRRYNKKGEVEIVKVTLPRPQYSSPKLVECARRVAASPHCGHLIFCEPTAVHLWLVEVLVEHGIPRDRIAIMNAAETKSADRLRIAREFNGLSSEPPPPGTCGGPSTTAITPKKDVIIGNSVMNEGLDLQTRTCSLHHLDLTWTPADLEQRNGRAVRQGNTLGIVQIYYYFAEGSTDGYRFSLIDGKAGWLGELIKSQVRDTNNPAAQQQLSPEDILLMISRDKDKTRAMLEDKRRRQAEEARKRIALEATRLYRQAAARFRAARVSDDAEVAARLREEGELRLADLERVDAEAWPWAPWMYVARDREVLIPDTGAPVYEGLRIARPRAGAEQLDHLEFGRIVDTDEGVRIGLRAAGSPSWQLVNYTGLVNDAPLLPTHLARVGGPTWPDDDDTATAAALDKKIPEVFRFGRYSMLRWRGASDVWLEKWWPRYEPALRDGLVKDGRDVVPVEGPKGLALASGDEIRDGKILLPTRAGWQRFLELAPASGEKFTALKDIGLEWWDRRVPQNLLSGGKDEPPDDAPPSNKPPRGEPPQTEPPSLATTLTAEQVAQMQSVLDEARTVDGTPEDLDRRVIDNLALTHAAMNDALAFGGASKADRSKLAEDARATAERITILRAVAGILRQRGYEVALAGQTQNSFNIIGRDGQLLAAASHGKMARYAPGLTGDELRRIEDDLAEARQTAKDIILEEARTRGPKVSEEMMLAVWRRARGSTEDTPSSPAEEAHMILRIQREATPDHPALDVQERVSSLEEASREYRRTVEASGEGASTFPAGQVVLPNGPTYKISHNGRVWDGDQKLYDPTPRAADPANTYEVARSAIRALGLPPSKYASYLRQAEAAITDGKSYEYVLKRARKAADKLGLGKRPEENRASPARAPQSSEIATILDTFNDEPRFRLASQRQGAGTQTYVVFREGSSADEAIAAIDVVNYDVDDVRWLDLRVPANDQDAILERMDRALWAAADAENAAEDNARSPLQDLSDMMERLVQARGVDLKASQSPKRADGYGAIAEALAELAEPAPMDAMQLEVWLESTGVFLKAAEVVADARGDNIKVPDLMRRLWREVLLAVPVTTISAGPSPVPTTADAAISGTLVVPDSALRRVRADGGVQATVLERHIREGRATLREIVVRVRGDATRPKWSIVSDATERLQPGAALHDNTHPDEFLRLLYSNINAFEDHLAEAPKRLADVRTLLYWTAAMLDAPLCQGDVKRRAAAALEQAQGYYDAARRQLIEGRTVDAARRIHEALRRISAAAAELAKSCGDGQTLLPGAAPAFEVTPADRDALALPATAAAPATAQLVRPAAAMMALVKPTPEQLRERFAASSRSDDAKAMPVYYIFRSRSGLPELLTREDIEARAREAVGHEVYDEAERNPMPGAELFESAIGAVELLLDAEFEGRADPRWASSILLNQQMNANREKQP